LLRENGTDLLTFSSPTAQVLTNMLWQSRQTSRQTGDDAQEAADLKEQVQRWTIE
jgi:hypothetical protein